MSIIHPNIRLSALGFVTEETQAEEARRTHPLWHGNHLRWTFNMAMRFPVSGFDLYRASDIPSASSVEAQKDKVFVESLAADLLRVTFHGAAPPYCELHGFKRNDTQEAGHVFVFNQGRQIRHLIFSGNLPADGVIPIQASVFDTILLYGTCFLPGKVFFAAPPDPKLEWLKLGHVPSLSEMYRMKYEWSSVVDRLPSGTPQSRVDEYQKAWEALLELYGTELEGMKGGEVTVLEEGKERVDLQVMQQIALLALDPNFAALIGLYFVDSEKYPALEIPPAKKGREFRYRVEATWPDLGETTAVSEPAGSLFVPSLRAPESPRTSLVPGVLEVVDHNGKRATAPLYRFRVAVDWDHNVKEMCEVRRVLVPPSSRRARVSPGALRPGTWSQPNWHVQADEARVEGLPARIVDIITAAEHDVVHQVRILDSWGRLSAWSIPTWRLPLRSDVPIPAPVNPRITVVNSQTAQLKLSWEYRSDREESLRFVVVRLPDEIGPSRECSIRSIDYSAGGLLVDATLPSVVDFNGARLRQGHHSFPIQSSSPNGESITLKVGAKSPEAAVPAELLPAVDKAEIVLDLTQIHYWQPVGVEVEYQAAMSEYEVVFEQPEQRPTLARPRRFPRYGVYVTNGHRTSIVAGPVIPGLFLSVPLPSSATPHPIIFEEFGVDSSGKRWIRLSWPEFPGYSYQVLRGTPAWVGYLLGQVPPADLPSGLRGLKIEEILDNSQYVHKWIRQLGSIPAIRRAFSFLNGSLVDKPEVRDYLPAKASGTRFIYLVKLVDPAHNSGEAYATGVFSPPLE